MAKAVFLPKKSGCRHTLKKAANKSGYFADISIAGTLKAVQKRGRQMGNKFLDGTALTIAIIGAINWALIGIFRFDLVAFIFGDMSWLSRIVYAIVGVCGLYLISFYMHLGSRGDAT